MRRLLHLVVPCLTILSGCYGPGEGVEVPQDEIYFPVGLALDPRPNRDDAHKGPEFLYVVSSDFDLQYNGGAIQSYKLNELEKPIDEGLSGNCQEERPPAEQLLYPGRCKFLNARDYKAGTVKIGAFATDAMIRAGEDVGDGEEPRPRLFVPVRGDSTLHYLDLEKDGSFSCGQQNNDGACDDAHRAGDNKSENSRQLTLGPEPFAIAADPKGETVVVTNQTTGTASLFVTDPAKWDVGPQLKFALASDRIPQRPVGVAYAPRLADYVRPPAEQSTDRSNGAAFLLAFRDSAQVRLVRYADDGESAPDRPYLVDGGGVGIDANSVGSDSRGIAVDDSARRKAVVRCGEDDAACLDRAALVPLDVYVANRAPASLLIGRTQPPQEYPYFYDTLPLTTGPSRVVVGQVHAALTGELETRVFIVCFDSRRIFVYDPKRSRIETEIFTARGPHAVVVDQERKLLYVSHFTDSYIGVYSLDLGQPETYGTLVASLGAPKAPRSSK
jgi:hypothetical protein